LRPVNSKQSKAQQGFFKERKGGSLRGSTVSLGDWGLQTIEGGRLSDTQLDAARTCLRRVLKGMKGAGFHLRVFTDRPVTKKAAETRMGKGKGNVAYYAKWVREGTIVFEVKGVPKDVAHRALTVAGSCLPLRTKI
ncbi:ribosomal protein L10e/L16, partial [Blyttiomyces helicus]